MTSVPPFNGPEFGVIEMICGCGSGVESSESELLSRDGIVSNLNSSREVFTEGVDVSSCAIGRFPATQAESTQWIWRPSYAWGGAGHCVLGPDCRIAGASSSATTPEGARFGDD